MKEIKKPAVSPATQVWITVAGVLFIGALTISALAVPQLRPLHFPGDSNSDARAKAPYIVAALRDNYNNINK